MRGCRLDPLRLHRSRDGRGSPRRRVPNPRRVADARIGRHRRHDGPDPWRVFRGVTMTLDLDAPPGRGAGRATASLPVRPRRMRRTPALRALVRETRLHPAMLVAPLFVRPGSGVREPVASMPGVERVSADVAAEEAVRLAELGVGGVILFGLPASKDALGSEASADDGIV